jgi:four helix bundle protein
MNDEGGRLPKPDLQGRTKRFALQVLKFYASLPRATEVQVLGKQLIRSGTSVGAHYREAMRARSSAGFISKMEVGLQELEETRYWFELLDEGGFVSDDRLSPLSKEAEELTAMFVASIKTAKRHR